jgi:hypothetical protein
MGHLNSLRSCVVFRHDEHSATEATIYSEVNNTWVFYGTISTVKVMGDKISYGRMSVNKNVGGAWEETAVKYFTPPSQNFLAGTRSG